MVRYPKIGSGERECFGVRPALCVGESVVKIYHPVFPVESPLPLLSSGPPEGDVQEMMGKASKDFWGASQIGSYSD